MATIKFKYDMFGYGHGSGTGLSSLNCDSYPPDWKAGYQNETGRGMGAVDHTGSSLYVTMCFDSGIGSGNSNGSGTLEHCGYGEHDARTCGYLDCTGRGS